jgi:hypothetical protein
VGDTQTLSFFILQTSQLVEKKRSSAFLDGFFSTNYDYQSDEEGEARTPVFYKFFLYTPKIHVF